MPGILHILGSINMCTLILINCHIKPKSSFSGCNAPRYDIEGVTIILLWGGGEGKIFP